MLKITKHNFQEFTKKHVHYVKGIRQLTRIDIPKNAIEFEQATAALYGVGLGVTCFAYPEYYFSHQQYCCHFRIEQPLKSYCQGEIMNMWCLKYGKYEPLKFLLIPIFGEIILGGVAEYEYGTTLCDKNTWDRIKSWDDQNQAKFNYHVQGLSNYLKRLF